MDFNSIWNQNFWIGDTAKKRCLLANLATDNRGLLFLYYYLLETYVVESRIYNRLCEIMSPEKSPLTRGKFWLDLNADHLQSYTKI